MDDQRLQNLSRHLREASSIINTLVQPTNASPSSSVSPPGLSSSSSSTATTSSLNSSSTAVSSTSGVGSVLNHARAMISSSVSNGTFSRLGRRERLRATSSCRQATSTQPQKRKKEEAKAFELVLVDVREGEQMINWSLTEDNVLLRGIVEIDSTSKEADIRERIGNCIRLKYSSVTNSDFEFLRATRRKLSKPVICGDFNFKQIKILAGQGSIYLKLKDWIYCLINEGPNSDDDTGKNSDVGQ